MRARLRLVMLLTEIGIFKTMAKPCVAKTAPFFTWKGKCYRLKKALYSLKTAGRQWDQCLDKQLRHSGTYKKCESEPCVYPTGTCDAQVILAIQYMSIPWSSRMIASAWTGQRPKSSQLALSPTVARCRTCCQSRSTTYDSSNRRSSRPSGTSRPRLLWPHVRWSAFAILAASPCSPPLLLIADRVGLVARHPSYLGWGDLSSTLSADRGPHLDRCLKTRSGRAFG